ncbi:hypothetical protein NDU88_001327 [Pleurodeles waltl]|uniref:RES domain-containing protein n=1 Tax=Pleurodeles waltl TaxID=8319 RepID=A0AAV7M2V2_PLEWA|nr:hypothetical protein NDU88_001327 [Pleurodeles waltl]
MRRLSHAKNPPGDAPEISRAVWRSGEFRAGVYAPRNREGRVSVLYTSEEPRRWIRGSTDRTACPEKMLSVRCADYIYVHA